MVRKVNGKAPIYSRIKIDYSKDKPAVKFSYPDKKSQFKGSMARPVIYGYIALLILITLLVSVSMDISNKINKPGYSECYNEYEYIYDTQKEEIIDNVCVKKAESFVQAIYYNVDDVEDIDKPKAVKKMILFFFLVFGLPCLIYFPFKKQWDNLFPKYQALGEKKKVKVFKPHEVITKDGKHFCEIPVFKNVVLNYEAKGDFSKHLELFEISEHKFKYYKARTYKKRKKPLTPKQKKKADLRRRGATINEFIWYAKFYFKERPKTGSLEVLFK